MGVEIELVEGRRATIGPQPVAVYREVFAIPPYAETEEDAARFADRLPRHAANDGFRCAVAHDGGRVVGFGYGYTSRPGQWWHDVVRAGLDPDEAERWPTGAFELAQLAVLAPWRGRGIGGRLHDRLLDGCPSPTAIASVIERDNPAVAFCWRRGWATLREGFRYPGVTGVCLVVVRRLRPTGEGPDR